MDTFQRALASLGKIKTPLTVTALTVIVFYYLLRQILQLGIFPQMTQGGAAQFLSILLDRVFWLAVIGFVFGGVLFALPYILPDRRSGKVELLDARLNSDLGTTSTKGRLALSEDRRDQDKNPRR